MFELTPSHGSWMYTVIYDFSAQSNGGPNGPVVVDSAGNLYGAGSVDGVSAVFKLTHSGDSWILTIIHTFYVNDGLSPSGHMVFDANGGLYGTATVGGGSGCNQEGCGTVWQITP